jgi:hypothetical protein
MDAQIIMAIGVIIIPPHGFRHVMVVLQSVRSLELRTCSSNLWHNIRAKFNKFLSRHIIWF